MSTLSGNDKFFAALLRNDLHPMTLKHPSAALSRQSTKALMAEDGGRGSSHLTRGESSKHSLMSARSQASQISLASSIMSQSTRRKKAFQAGFTNTEERNSEYRLHDDEAKHREREANLAWLQKYFHYSRLTISIRIQNIE